MRSASLTISIFFLYSKVMSQHHLNVNDLLTKDLDRREFLQYLGLFFLAIIGVSGFLKNLSHITPITKKNGFGKGVYGK